MLDETAYAEMDARLAPVDAELRRRYPSEPYARQPVHTLSVPADLFGPGVLREYGRLVRRIVAEHRSAAVRAGDHRSRAGQARPGAGRGPADRLRGRVRRARRRRGGCRGPLDRERAALQRMPAFFGLRCKSLEGPTRRRAVRTLDMFLDALGPPPPGFVITLPKVSTAEQVEAMVILCGQLEKAHGLPRTFAAVRGPDRDPAGHPRPGRRRPPWPC